MTRARKGPLKVALIMLKLEYPQIPWDSDILRETVRMLRTGPRHLWRRSVRKNRVRIAYGRSPDRLRLNWYEVSIPLLLSLTEEVYPRGTTSD